MPRILFGVTVPMTANAFLRGQLALLVEQGWDVHLATSPDDGYERLQELTGVTLHALPMRRQPAPLADFRALTQWLRLVRRVRPDVVVSSTPKAGLLGMVSSRIAGTASRVYHVRGLRGDGLTGLMRKISFSMERIACSCATSVLCDSPSLGEQMRILGILRSDQGVILGAGSACGVDIERFRPPTAEERREVRRRLHLTDENIVIGFVGRLTADKGVRELICASTRVHERLPETRLVLVGPVEDGAFEVPTDSWMTHVDFVEDPAAFYWAFDVFCLPSYREGFPIAPLEAMASGIPVITTDATGCMDAVLPGQTGEVVPAGETVPLAATLEAVLSDGEYRSAMGRAARAWAQRDFDATIVSARFVAYLLQTYEDANEIADSHDQN